MPSTTSKCASWPAASATAKLDSHTVIRKSTARLLLLLRPKGVGLRTRFNQHVNFFS